MASNLTRHLPKTPWLKMLLSKLSPMSYLRRYFGREKLQSIATQPKMLKRSEEIEILVPDKPT